MIRDRRSGPLDRLAAALRASGRAAGRPVGDARPPFVEGLLLGAMIGAAIAGSTVWSRWRHRRDAAPPASTDASRGEPKA